MRKEISKVILYAYPWLDKLAEASETAAMNRAVLSYKSPRDAASDAEGVIDEVALACSLRELREDVDKVLGEMDAEELFLLEYRYFRRREKIALFGKVELPYSVREYFRRQCALLDRVSLALEGQGWAERFFERFGKFPPFCRLLSAVSGGRERSIVGQRRRRGFCAHSSSGGAGGRRLPLTTSTAMAIAAADARQMATICTVDVPPMSEEEGSLSPEAGPEGTVR